MTTFTTEDRETAAKEPIPFYGWHHLDGSANINKSEPLPAVLNKAEINYKIDDGSEDLEY